MIELDETHDPAATSWVDGADAHPEFPVQNLPLGVFTDGDRRHGCMAIGDYVLDLGAISSLLDGEAAQAAALACWQFLNPLFNAGNAFADALRKAVFQLLTDERHRQKVEPALHRVTDVYLRLPFQIGDYTDFYTGIHHAENVGKQFRPDNPLLPNYKWVPIGYHGRSSSVLPSGTHL